MNCKEECLLSKKCCKKNDCRHWIDYEKDLNCSLITVEENGPLTLREVADRLQISYVRVKQIQDKAVAKIMKKVRKENF